MKRERCLFCSSKKMTKIIDLGNHPFADTFIPEDRVNDRLPVYNLSCAKCNKCNQIQTISKTILRQGHMFSKFKSPLEILNRTFGQTF